MVKQPSALPPDEALRRVFMIVDLLAEDVRHALIVRPVFRAANDAVRAAGGQPTLHADSYSVVANSIILTLAIALARVLDVAENRSIEDQHKASIPVLAALLARPDVSQALINRARAWVQGDPELGEEDCRIALQSAAAIMVRLKSEPLASARSRLREFRNHRLAHHLFDKQPDVLPQVRDLCLLTDAVAEFASQAQLGIRGQQPDYQGVESSNCDRAFRFWTLAFAALTAQTDGHLPN